jgi:hypothetical protein
VDAIENKNMEVKKMYKKIGILAIVGMLLLTMGFADGIAAHSKREVISILNNPVVLGPDVTPVDNTTDGYLGDFTIQGTAISKFDRIGAWGWTVYVDKVVEGPTEMKDKTISVYLTSADPTVYPRGSIDSNISAGDIVEAYGGPASGYDISLTGSANYYLKYLGLPVTMPSGPQNTATTAAVDYTIIAFNLTSRPSYLVTDTGQQMPISWINGTGYINGAPDLTLQQGTTPNNIIADPALPVAYDFPYHQVP